MTTVRTHYDVTAQALNAETGWHVEERGGSNQQLILGKISYSLEENVRYWSFFFPEGVTLPQVEYILRMPDTLNCVITGEPSQLVGFADSPERYRLDSLVFSKRIYLYIDAELSLNDKQHLNAIGTTLGLSIQVRDREYVRNCIELSKPAAFISHDSRDKDTLVRELARNMSVRCTVWYDEYSLKVGDSLRESIERGLKEAKKCIIILSPNFISNGGWTKAEFDSIYSREIHEKRNVILPVWHNVSKNEVYEYCPRLVDRVALPSSIGVHALSEKLAQAIMA
ncbi:MAG TPA: toll/interleukin-1 receptor domain-containing protein [Gallionellaceae bacterium]